MFFFSVSSESVLLWWFSASVKTFTVVSVNFFRCFLVLELSFRKLNFRSPNFPETSLDGYFTTAVCQDVDKAICSSRFECERSLSCSLSRRRRLATSSVDFVARTNS